MAYNVPAYAMFLPASILFYQKKRAKIWVKEICTPYKNLKRKFLEPHTLCYVLYDV